MDPILNPFSPGAGVTPPELVGRDGVLQDIKILIGRVSQKRPERSLLLTGLRGVGKTVLLIQAAHIARQNGCRTFSVEAHEDKSLAGLIAPSLRTLLLDLNRMEGAKEKARQGLAVFRSFLGAVKISVGEFTVGVDVAPALGSADSGDLEIDLPNLFVAIGEAAEERNTAVVIIIDEIQYLKSNELGALIMAMHRVQQNQLPIALIGAGLPILLGLAGQSKSYAERLFRFPEIGKLSVQDAGKALQDPAQAQDVTFTPSALEEIFQLTYGYPYFIQEWGYQAWNMASSASITRELVEEITESVIRGLDESFFRVRFDRLAPSEKRFLRAMADLSSDAKRTGDLADHLGVKNASLGPTRASLIRKGMIYSPAHGDIAFTVPLFDDFMRRAIPALD